MRAATWVDNARAVTVSHPTGEYTLFPWKKCISRARARTTFLFEHKLRIARPNVHFGRRKAQRAACAYERVHRIFVHPSFECVQASRHKYTPGTPITREHASRRGVSHRRRTSRARKIRQILHLPPPPGRRPARARPPATTTRTASRNEGAGARSSVAAGRRGEPIRAGRGNPGFHPLREKRCCDALGYGVRLYGAAGALKSRCGDHDGAETDVRALHGAIRRPA